MSKQIVVTEHFVLKIPDALASGALEIEGDGSRFAVLFAMLDPPAGLMFEVLTPGEGR